eukprot:385689-Prymnesium_polylepis.1
MVSSVRSKVVAMARSAGTAYYAQCTERACAGHCGMLCAVACCARWHAVRSGMLCAVACCARWHAVRGGMLCAVVHGAARLLLLVKVEHHLAVLRAQLRLAPLGLQLRHVPLHRRHHLWRPDRRRGRAQRLHVDPSQARQALGRRGRAATSARTRGLLHGLAVVAKELVEVRHGGESTAGGVVLRRGDHPPHFDPVGGLRGAAERRS